MYCVLKITCSVSTLFRRLQYGSQNVNMNFKYGWNKDKLLKRMTNSQSGTSSSSQVVHNLFWLNHKHHNTTAYITAPRYNIIVHVPPWESSVSCWVRRGSAVLSWPWGGSNWSGGNRLPWKLAVRCYGLTDIVTLNISDRRVSSCGEWEGFQVVMGIRSKDCMPIYLRKGRILRWHLLDFQYSHNWWQEVIQTSLSKGSYCMYRQRDGDSYTCTVSAV